MIIKTCSTGCGETILYSKGVCKKCYMKEYNRANYKKKKETIKAQTLKYYYDNIEKGRKQRREYARKNKRQQYLKEYYEHNKEVLRLKQQTYYINNKDELGKKQYQYKKAKLKHDLEYYIKDRLSTRIRMAILNHKGTKNTSSIELLGASIDVVRKHIESQFLPGMTWENHGMKGWHIDHIIPCDSFDLRDMDEQKRCFNYKNLQPLWAEDNLEKGASIE